MKKKKSVLYIDQSKLPILILIIINLAIGVFTFHSYGESYDEAGLRKYADQSLAAYTSLSLPSYSPDLIGDYFLSHGPAYVMGVELCVRFAEIFTPSLGVIDTWHLVYFITFQIAVFCMYLLGRRWMSNWAAFGSAFLFSTQPLLWGHAFINPKDTPFMAFFLASIVTGLWMCDLSRKTPRSEISRFQEIKIWLIRSIQNWRNASQRLKKVVLILSGILILSILFLTFAGGILFAFIAGIIQKGYSADPLSWLGRLFNSIAHNTANIPVDVYIRKAQTLFTYIRNDYILLGLILIILLLLSIILRGIRFPLKREILSFIRQLGIAFTRPTVIIGGIILGFTTSIRILGPLAGLIVALYALWRYGKSIFPQVLAYTFVGIIAMIITWPYLWSAPIANLLESLKTMSAFPWQGRVLFNGTYFSPDNLPRSYVPTLMSIQLTEPVIFLFVTGFIIAARDFLRFRKMEFLGTSMIWFFIPLGGLIITRPPIYDNFRQLLFLLPPIFIFCGIALDVLFKISHKWLIKTFILLLVIFPGIYGIANLHPYEYIYYNSFVGGVGGAFKNYETDYWMTSYREAANYLNKTAETDSKVIVWGASQLVTDYSRPDLIVEPTGGNSYDLTGGYNYAVLSSRFGYDTAYPDNAPVFTVERDNAILDVVKRLSPLSSP